ncbi:MAG TPA: cupredoxin domain-containing protein [Actinomycetota bacterium]|nr:cupredoxin domain-containing protein [Actinomycetota bacterium]
MKRTTRDRFVLPIALPLGILVIILAALYGFSRILLAVSHNAATVTALLVALAIVVVAAIVSGRRYVRLSSLAGMVGAVAGVAMVAGGVAVASLDAGEEGGEGEGPSQAITILAVNLAFEPTSVTVPAGQPFQIVLDNQDAGVQHNIQIFPGAEVSGTPTFEGELITGPAQVTYDVPALEPGTYAFNCVVHPNMTGTIEAVEGGGGGGGPSIQVAAQNIAFDTDTIELPADTPATIVFDNRDAGVQHNIAIYEDDTLAAELFKGELITGPETIEYQIPPLPPGEYFFQCDVHPNMNGVVVVTGEGGGGEPSETGPPAGPTGGDGGGATTTVTAQGIAFDTAEIALPAGQPTTIHFVNQDAGVQHNISITTDETKAESLFDGELITGPAEADYQVPALEPGTYYFYCVVHPNMNGVVTVG